MVRIDITIASGRGTCQICKSIIDKCEKQVLWENYKGDEAARYHILCVHRFIDDEARKVMR